MSIGIGIAISPVFGGVAPFTPLIFGDDLIAWYDATDASSITLNGADVSQWDDLSVSGNHLVQATAADQPLYNTGVSIEFDGVSENLQSSNFTQGVQAQPNTLVIVLKDSRTTTGNSYYFDGNDTTNRHIFLWEQSSNRKTIWAGGPNAYGSAPDTSFHIFIAEWDDPSGASKLYEDGALDINTSSSGSKSTDGITLGGRYDGTQFNNVEIKEAFFVNRLLTTAEKNQVGNYLAGKHSGTTWTDIP